MKLGEVLGKTPEIKRKIVLMYLKELKELLEKDKVKAKSIAEKVMDFMPEHVKQEFYYRVYMPLFDNPRDIRRRVFS